MLGGGGIRNKVYIGGGLCLNKTHGPREDLKDFEVRTDLSFFQFNFRPISTETPRCTYTAPRWETRGRFSQ